MTSNLPEAFGSMSDRTTLIFRDAMGLDPGEVREMMRRHHLALEISEEQAHSPNGQAILLMALNLLVRLDMYSPRITVSIPPSVPILHRSPLLGPGDIASSLARFVGRLDRQGTVTFGGRAPFPDVVLSVGRAPACGTRHTIQVASDGWICHLSALPHQLAPVANRANVIGAYGAATIAAGEVVKRLLDNCVGQRPGYKAADSLVFSLFDYGTGDPETINPALPESIDLGDICLVGAGGSGSAFVETMGSIAGIRGRLTALDPDILEPHSLNRHLISTWDTLEPAGQPVFKAHLVQEFLCRIPGLVAGGLVSSYGGLVAAQRESLSLVVITVDDEAARLQVQSDLPRTILLGGYRDLACLVARVDFPGTACLRCFSQLGITGNPANPAPSISFASALPGVLLAGEVVKERTGVLNDRVPLNGRRNRFLVDLSRVPDETCLISVPKVCPDCQSPESLKRFQEKWGL